MKQYNYIPKVRLIRDISSPVELYRVRHSYSVLDFIRKEEKLLFEDEMQVRERMIILYLSRGNEIIAWDVHSIGTTTSSTTDRKIITKTALDMLCSAVVVVHNHPSGNNQPSDSDKTVCSAIKDSLKLFDITLLDFLIITSNNHYSFADEGIL